jgi:hypothetical protein
VSDIEDLELIAEASAFGFAGVQARHPRLGRHPASETCGGGHPWTEASTRLYKYRGRWRRICRLCDKARLAQRRALRIRCASESES